MTIYNYIVFFSFIDKHKNKISEFKHIITEHSRVIIHRNHIYLVDSYILNEY